MAHRGLLLDPYDCLASPDLAADFSEASPFPTPDDIQKDVYWETDHPGERASQGRLFFD